MKEYGGYIEFENYHGEVYHSNALALSNGRAGVEYLVRAKKAQKIYLPFYMCDCIYDTCKKCGIEVEYYNIKPDFTIVLDKEIEEHALVYIVNYFGQLQRSYLEACVKRYKNVVVDNTHAFFEKPIEGADCIYNCRKYFGVPDGGYLYTDVRLETELEEDVSYDRLEHLLGRYEKSASEFYAEFQARDREFLTRNARKMSKLTCNLMRGISYDFVKKARTDNMNRLIHRLGKVNKLAVTKVDGGFMYPFYVENGQEVRKKLIAQKIYIPVLWADALEICQDEVEVNYVNNILPLPIDQRYTLEDMDFIADKVLELCGYENR